MIGLVLEKRQNSRMAYNKEWEKHSKNNQNKGIMHQINTADTHVYEDFSLDVLEELLEDTGKIYPMRGFNLMTGAKGHQRLNEAYALHNMMAMVKFSAPLATEFMEEKDLLQPVIKGFHDLKVDNPMLNVIKSMEDFEKLFTDYEI